MLLQGSCHCKGIEFEIKSETPLPYNCCYCNLCTKTAGGGGNAINIMGLRKTLRLIKGEHLLKTYQAALTDTQSGKDGDPGQKSKNIRYFCSNCASYLFILNDTWPEWAYPFASAIDTPLPEPQLRHHLMLEFKKPWAQVPLPSEVDHHFKHYPTVGIYDFHKQHGWLQLDPPK